MDGLEHGRALADVAPGNHPQAADEAGAQVGNDVAEQVGGHDDVELFRPHHQLHAAVVDDQLVVLDVRILRGDFARVSQILSNLINNALKFRGDEAPRVSVSVRRDGGDWVLHGSPPDELAQIHCARRIPYRIGELATW